MPIVGVVIAVAVDVAAEVGAADLVATIAAGTIFADAAGTLTVVGDIAAGALGGLVGGAVTAGIEGTNPLIGGLEGAAGGALTGGITGAVGGASLTGGDLPTSAAATDVGTGTLSGSQGFFSSLTSSVANITGLPTQAVNTVLKTLTGAATGALKNAATGQDPGAGALGGAISGGGGAALGSVAGSVIDVNTINQIASDTGLPTDVVKGVINGLGQAATGAAASAATGGDPGIAAAGDFLSGSLQPALQYAYKAANSLYNTLTSGGQQAVTDLVDSAQTKIAGIQTNLSQTWDGVLAQAQASYQQSVTDANSQLQTLANQPMFGLQIAEAVSQDPNAFPEVQTALSNLQSVTAQAQQAEQDAQTQVSQIVDTTNTAIAAYQDPQGAASQYFDQAFQTAAQGLNNGDTPDQVQAAVNGLNPLGQTGSTSNAGGTIGSTPSNQSGGVTFDPSLQNAFGNTSTSGGTTTTDPTGAGGSQASQENGAADTGTATGTGTNFDFTPTVSPQDQQIMKLAGLTSPESAQGGSAPSGTGAANAAPKQTNFNFVGGFNSAAPGQPTQAPNIEPGSAALAQALSIPGAGPGLGGDIFGTKGQRTPIWNLESLRAEDTSGV